MMRFFAHAAGQKDLAHHIVDLVRAGVVELFALEIELGAAKMLGQPFGGNKADWDGPHNV